MKYIVLITLFMMGSLTHLYAERTRDIAMGSQSYVYERNVFEEK